MNKSATAILCILAMVALMNLERASSAFAAPVAQSTPAASPTPTDEPPKPPYVFPTPIFIPTFPGDTPSVPAAPRTPGQPSGQTTYVVEGGDSPWIIAQKVYGNGSKYPLIMSANALTDSTRLRVGMTLNIPPLDGAQPPSTPAPPPAVAPTSSLPPPAETSPAPDGISATPTVTPTQAPADLSSSAASGLATAAINIIAALLLIGAFGAAILAFLSYNRTRRLEELNPSKRNLQMRQ